VHVLLWDYSLLYALEREPLPRLNLDWRTPRRVKVCLDGRLPIGASHHEKIAVIDDRVAYCGGLDLTIRRWDRSDHRANEPDRKDPNGELYGPYHDLQMVVDGEAAASLADLLRSRWRDAAGRRLRPVAVESDPWPDGVEPELRDVDVGISRTRPAFDGDSELRQVESAYLNAIALADRLIYIENQYLTAGKIARALTRRLREKETLEVVIVNPKSPRGWLEQHTMGIGRARFMRELGSEDVADRVAVLYPWVGDGAERVPVMVHAKLMIVDDRLLHVGSSNLNCRSMGVDGECDLEVEAGTDAQRAGVAGIRRKLVAHHLGMPADELAAREEQERSLIALIEGHASEARGLGRLDTLAEPNDLPIDLLVDLADPERPIDPEEFIGNLFGAMPAKPIRRHFRRLAGAAVLVGIALVVWRFSPLVEWADPERIAALLEGIDENPWAELIVLAAFVLGSFVVFPVTVLIAATAVVLGPLDGFVWASIGALSAASANFALGRAIPRARLERWVGARIGRRLKRGGIVSMMIVRNVPIAPFTVVNVVAGAVRIPFRDYLIGTVLGMGPGIAALTILGDRLRGILRDPSWLNWSLLVLAVVLWIGVALGLQALSNRMADAR
jgi:phosphatidylserine/phosphatidylglycerophosphate/cardiolipin synthase-like enzyme/uncharacterized membrane protein YdjX (TVP38/TMEM64 family)